MVIVLEVDTVTRVQIQDEYDGISHSINTLGDRYESNYSPSRYG